MMNGDFPSARPGTAATYTMDDSDEEDINLPNSDEEEPRKTTSRRPKSSKQTFLTQSRSTKRGGRRPKVTQAQSNLEERPPWVQLSIRGAMPTPDMTVTHINQTYDKVRARDMAAMFNEGQTSTDWLKNHSIEHFNLTLKDLLSKGQIVRPKSNIQKSSSSPKELKFEASVVNEFEYKLYESIEMYHNRIRWLLKGSRKTFGMIKGNKVAIVVDSSDSNCGFGRVSHFRDSLTTLIDEQLHNREMLYFMSFGTDTDSLWHTPRYTNIRILDEARYWVNSLSGMGGCNLLAAIKKVLKVKDVDSIVVVMGSCPDQSAEALVEYIEQVIVGRQVPLHCVAFDCNNHLTNLTLRKLADISGGRYHVYASGAEEQIYTGTDITMLLREIRIAQDVINKIQEMRQGMMGDALVSILNEISLEVQKLPQSRFLPRPPNHTTPLAIEEPSFLPKTSEEWLQQNGLKGKRLSLYQVLAPNAFNQIEEFIPVIRKSVRSQTHEKAMTQFEWHDGTIKNIHVDPALLFDYQKQLGATVKLYERRVDWLSKESRRLFGTLTEKRVVILIDLSLSNVNYLVHIQHSIRLLLQQQLLNKESFNLIGFGSSARAWRPCMQEPTEENIQMAWKWVLGLECSGSRNFLSALRLALENEEDQKRNTSVDGVYLFTSGIPDQLPEVICSFMEEATVGQSTRLHSILFNVDDYDSNGAIPGRYANITQMAECLRTLAHVTSGRFHWFRETGIIESDDIKAILSEMDKAVNYSQKCALLVDSVKKRSPKYQAELMSNAQEDQPKMLPMRPQSAKKRALPAPKHTELSLARLQITENKDKEETKPIPRSRPSSAKKDPSKLDSNRLATEKDKKSKRPTSAHKVKPAKQVFYTEFKNEVGTVYKQYPDILNKKKSVRKAINHPVIPDREELKTSKEWLKLYGLCKLRLDLNKLVSGPECTHAKRHINTLNKAVTAKYCTIFPSVNVKGSVRHLQVQAHELQDYEVQIELVLRRYLRRLQWLLGTSRRTFGVMVEKKVVVLVDTSGSMVSHMEELKREMVALIWDQFQRENISFNLIRFSGDIEPWRNGIVEPTEVNCHDAVRWISTFAPVGNTCTLEALQRAFQDKDVEAIYLLTDGKPDSSTSRVLREVAQVNTIRGVKIHTISFNCEDETANIFLRQLAAMCRGRYHRCYAGMDGDLMAHRLLEEGFKNTEHPMLPTFDSDDLRQLVAEIEQARHFLSQSRSFRQLFGTTTKPHEKSKTSRQMPPNHIKPMLPAGTS
ncbi:von Willebrand factor A domain-containing protein 3A-like isoform X3 [Asterias rubens]|uniref:von Willebrand factor A domain-containing protein 3A-like isoform X3 n=1 Tax=Asterias rubens TaxID=7604 RepID=UPI0014551C1C|nr:von Willebrand factor A domain-containing protein 3A-like isoform X3 [Asterias rubens]